MQKVADPADISVLFFSAGANFWAILGHFGSFLGHFGSFFDYFGSFWVIFGPFFGVNFFGKICICAI